MGRDTTHTSFARSINHNEDAKCIMSRFPNKAYPKRATARCWLSLSWCATRLEMSKFSHTARGIAHPPILQILSGLGEKSSQSIKLIMSQ